MWAGALSCYVDILDKLQKRVCRTVAPTIAASHGPFGHHRNVASLNLFHRYFLGRCSSELAELSPLAGSCGKPFAIPYKLYAFLVTVLGSYKDVSVNSFLPHTARLWNSMMAECFPLTYGLNSFKPRVNRHLPHFSLLRRWGSAPTSHSTSWKFPHSPTSKKTPSRLPPTHQIFIAPPPTKGSSFPPADKKVPSQQNSPPTGWDFPPTP